MCDRLIDDFVDKGSVDLVTDYADRLPVQAITMTIGAPIERAPFFRQWALDRLVMLRGAPNFTPQQRDELIGRARELIVCRTTIRRSFGEPLKRAEEASAFLRTARENFQNWTAPLQVQID